MSEKIELKIGSMIDFWTIQEVIYKKDKPYSLLMKCPCGHKQKISITFLLNNEQIKCKGCHNPAIQQYFESLKENRALHTCFYCKQNLPKPVLEDEVLPGYYTWAFSGKKFIPYSYLDKLNVVRDDVKRLERKKQNAKDWEIRDFIDSMIASKWEEYHRLMREIYQKMVLDKKTKEKS